MTSCRCQASSRYVIGIFSYVNETFSFRCCLSCLMHVVDALLQMLKYKQAVLCRDVDCKVRALRTCQQ